MEMHFAKEDGYGIFSFESGMILYDTIAELKENFELLIDKIQENLGVIIDFNKISFIDSSGLGFLVNMSKKIREKGSELILTGLHEKVNEIFRLTGISPYFTILNNKQEAKNYLKE